ncbi:hypothetical protein UU9_11060 [Rhodanobacter fulvus Jip2]|uniref:Uncharacterized protein n=1 Tax=Rhodanobacter fulvus Jip2 TaxID=1163408 RepID=I4VNI7_9GAMM|nr:hypothetical protein [Rhodanobacter fulvus]EIL88778.1 hypothetical protein UU9_11060 [Rhodanobacter fulvus Jip2]
MKDKRFWFGLLVTVAWLGFSGYMVSIYAHPKELDAWGDYFSGLFAPLAFLWLVIGYMQQGEELKHSTEALRLQAEELRNSVEQQSQLVAVTREQFQNEYEALQDERELRREAARPRFVPQHSGTVVSSGVTTYKLKIVNIGNTATRFRLAFGDAIEVPKHHNLAVVARDEVIVIELRFVLTAVSQGVIRYIDADGLPGEVKFDVQAPGGNKLIIGDVVRVA